jgi:hypothetical protein
MNEIHHFSGRGVDSHNRNKADSIKADPEHVFVLVDTIAGIQFNTVYTRLFIVDTWGVRVVNPFRRNSLPGLKLDQSEYLNKDLFVFRPCRFDMIVEQEWMTR